MAKRYYNAKKKKSMNMDRLGANLERKLERRDEGVIFEDRNAFANMPPYAIMKPYSTFPYNDMGYRDDTIMAIDEKARQDLKKMRAIYKQRKA